MIILLLITFEPLAVINLTAVPVSSMNELLIIPLMVNNDMSPRGWQTGTSDHSEVQLLYRCNESCSRHKDPLANRCLRTFLYPFITSCKLSLWSPLHHGLELYNITLHKSDEKQWGCVFLLQFQLWIHRFFLNWPLDVSHTSSIGSILSQAQILNWVKLRGNFWELFCPLAQWLSTGGLQMCE